MIIVNGHFSKNGNFIGIDYKNEEVHIYKEQMDLHNLKSIENIIFPLFVIAKIKTFDRYIGEFGEEKREPIINKAGSKQTFDRLTALSVYLNFDSYINIFTTEIILNKIIIEHRNSIAKSAGMPNLSNPKINFSEIEAIKNGYIEVEKVFKEYFEYKITVNEKLI
ncbi:hypothetical protein Q1W71_11840 [Flavobacterium pectinovorum]|uniref:hypothetical protein n=1 Tax=Flavobacterium pectinovorum TaxID=29533 RepID=UPI00265FD32A|nr:hypothetical protein [Flavobacterium pectinovorum]WKL50436.1 hypothetical protein Q1W71_11840 [Flavobacterium pectinovorum]